MLIFGDVFYYLYNTKWYYIGSKNNFILKLCHSKQCLGATQA